MCVVGAEVVVTVAVLIQIAVGIRLRTTQGATRQYLNITATTRVVNATLKSIGATATKI